jgi:hypothetical protein
VLKKQLVSVSSLSVSGRVATHACSFEETFEDFITVICCECDSELFTL